MPGSGYSSTFLGRKAWSSPLPALLAYRTNTPIFVTSTVREKGKYKVHLSRPLYPNLDAPADSEVPRLMTETLALFEETVRACPDQWMWIHNRWKQQTTKAIPKRYRHDSIALFLPDDPILIQQIPQIRTLYPTEDLFIHAPQKLISTLSGLGTLHPYTQLEETLRDDLRYKLIPDFTQSPKIQRHYRKKGAQTLLQLSSFEELKKRLSHA